MATWSTQREHLKRKWSCNVLFIKLTPMKYQSISLLLCNHSNSDLFLCKDGIIFMCENIMVLCKSSPDISLVFI